MINDHKTEEWKIQLNMYINFISSKDTGETRTAYVWSDNEEIRRVLKQMLLIHFLNLFQIIIKYKSI